MRKLIVGVLHPQGFHRLCRRLTIPLRDVGYRLDDGTIWKPDINGVITFGHR